MESEITHNAFKVAADPAKGTMQISLMKDGADLGSVRIDTKEASRIAGILLGAATRAYDLSGKPPPYYSKEEKIDLTAISPSGLNIGPGRKPKSAMLMFHFGETTLGLEVPQSEALTFAQRLMTVCAEGSAQ